MAELDATLAALQMAIQTEIDGHNFYQRCADATADQSARRMFDRLAQDEVMHLEMLRSTMAMLQERGEWAEYRDSASVEVGGAPIFSRERVRQNVTAYTSDMSALRLAYLIEKDAVDFYTRAASEVENENGRRMFSDLARMEAAHLSLLESEYSFVRDQFQHAMGFAPF